jgi:hypothetical protein
LSAPTSGAFPAGIDNIVATRPEGVSDMKSKIGAIIFFLLLFVVAFGLISFSTEFFLGKPLIKVIRDFLFMLYRK